MGVIVAFVALTAFFVVSRRRSRDNLIRFGSSNGRITPESELLDGDSAAAFGAVGGGKAVDVRDHEDGDGDHHHHHHHHSGTRRFRSLKSEPEITESTKAYYPPSTGRSSARGTCD